MSLLDQYDMSYNVITLQFKDNKVEKEFVAWIEPTKRLQVRMAFFLVTLLYSLYAVAESFIVPSPILSVAHTIHIFIVIPMVFFSFLVSFHKFFNKIIKYVAIIAVYVAAFGNLYLVYHGGLDSFYSIELYLMIFWVFTVAGFRLSEATFLAVSICIIAVVTIFYGFADTEDHRLIYSYFFWLFIAFSLAYLGGHLLEYSAKVNFLKEKMLQKEIQERLLAEEKLKFTAYHDDLTQLPNRALLFNRIEEAKKKEIFAWMLVDLDHFKDINDQMGHHAGDLLLQMVARRLIRSVRESDTVCRFGGDEFTILLSDINNKDEAVMIAQKIKKALFEPFHLFEYGTLHISCSIGIAIYPEHGSNISELLKHADEAMYISKDKGRNAVTLYAQE